MSISTIQVPTTRRSGRKPRLSDEDFEDLANAVRAGEWASDNEPTTKKTAAWQRAQAAKKILGQRFKLVVKTKAFPAPDGQGFLWAVGPYPEGETPRGAAQSA